MDSKPPAITPPAMARPARLRADRIRRDTLVQLAAALAEDHDGSVQNVLNDLIDAGPAATDHALDALVADLEDTAGMGRADMALTTGDLHQLADDAARAVAIAEGTITQLPTQRDRRWTA